MKSIICILYTFFFSSFCFAIIFLKLFVEAHAQEGSYSKEAQEILDTYSADNLDVFKFSINNILNSDGDIVEKPAGNPSIFGRTDYGSEFFLENELSTAFSIEIPAFVINDLALDPLGEYFPVIIDGTQDLNIDFKDLYDTKSGEVITPEMGFVKLINEPTSSDLDNLSDGEIVEFFVRPSDTYLNQHNGKNLFFIDRPIPENPIVTAVDSDEVKYSEAFLFSDEDKSTILEPGEELITLPSGEVKIYVTSVYVPAPASRFEPTQVVMPVLADGDYNYEIEPALAETFSDEVQVVAIPDEEAEMLSKKVKEIKKKKATSSHRKDDDNPPALDPKIEAIIKLELLLNNAQKSPNKLLLETKKNIKKEFPNMSNALINLIINTATTDEKFSLMRNPKKFLDNEFSKISNPLKLNLIQGTDLSQNELTKIYNLIIFKFSKELANLGFDIQKNQKINYSVDITNFDQVLEQIQLQEDIMATISLLAPDRYKQALSSLLIDPIKVNPNSSNALFMSGKNQRVFDQIKRFSEVINFINNSSSTITTSEDFLDNGIPIVEINVSKGENIAKALEKKYTEDRRLNRTFQSRSFSYKFEKLNFELVPENKLSAPAASPPLLAEFPNITDQQLQLVAETTEATNNILKDSIKRMLKELGDLSLSDNTGTFVLEEKDGYLQDQLSSTTKQDLVFSNALLSAKRLQEIEDIRAIFEILGIGS